jgi:N utilization substance protein A
MKNDMFLAFSELLEDKQLPKEIVIDALEAAMVSAYRKTVNASSAQEVVAKFDIETGDVTIFAEKEVVDEVQDDRTEVLLEVAQKVEPEVEYGDIVMVESTPDDFGRVAAQTARQVIQQRIREAERQAQYDHFKVLEGEIVNGIVQAINAGGVTLGLDRRAEGNMPRNHQIRGERFRLHDRVRALLLEVKMTPRGPSIILSRAHKNFLRRLLEDEVPEIYNGMVEIRSIAREPGYRSKVAVAALQPGIDPVGACVGIRGVRIQAIVRELHDEKIDVIEWNPDPAAFIAKALSPARVNGVYLDETRETKTATVVVPEDQLSLAIGRDGQNARLAAKLTTWRIDIKSLPEATSEALYKLQERPEMAEEAEKLADTIQQVEVILARKEEGRPITPEEYQMLGRFVNKVETGVEDQRQAELEAQKAKEDEIRALIPSTAFHIPLDDLPISPRHIITLTGEGFSTIGDLMLQLKLDSDVILAIQGLGPKTMEEIQKALDEFEFPEPEEEVVVEAEAEVELPAEEAVEPEAEAEVEPEAEAEEAEPVMEAEAAEPVVEEELEEEEAVEEEAVTFEEVIAASEITFIEDEEEDDELQRFEKDREKGSKKKKYRQVEYDPDLDVTIVRRRRKRETDEWDEENWEEYLD